MSERWPHPRDAARDAVAWGLIETEAKERKEEARLYVANHLKEESSRGVDAYAANGALIGSVTRSKPGEKTDVTDWEAFLAYVVQHQPHMLTVEYRAKDAFLRKLKAVGGVFIDPEGTVVPGVETVVTQGRVTVNKEPDARNLVRRLLSRVDTTAIGGKPQIEDV